MQKYIVVFLPGFSVYPSIDDEKGISGFKFFGKHPDYRYVEFEAVDDQTARIVHKRRFERFESTLLCKQID